MNQKFDALSNQNQKCISADSIIAEIASLLHIGGKRPSFLKYIPPTFPYVCVIVESLD